MRMNVEVNDIKKFLSQQGYVWYGYISTGHGPQIASDQDFEDPFEHNILFVKAGDEDINIAVSVTATYFELSRPVESKYHSRRFEDVDLSNAWQKFMLSRHKEQYAPILKQWCETSKRMVQRKYEQDKQRTYLELDKVKQSAQKELDNIAEVQKMLGESVEEITL